MSADDPKIDRAQLARDSEPPIRPEPEDGGIAGGQRGEIENNANTDTVRNAVSDLDGDRDDQPDSDNPNDLGEG